MAVRITHVPQQLSGEILLPASKSESNRALVLEALCPEISTISNLSVANDTLLMQQLLKEIAEKAGASTTTLLDARDAGTVFRFLCAYCAQTPGKWLLTGTPRMKKRPIRTLVAALAALGADIEYAEAEEYPPLLIHGKSLHGASLEMDATVSSQFASALLLIAPALQGPLTLSFQGEAVSRPYIHLTLGYLRKFGIKTFYTKEKAGVIPSSLHAVNIKIGADWSAAAFWYAWVVLLNGKLSFPDLQLDSLQGDKMLETFMRYYGVVSTPSSNGISIHTENTPVKKDPLTMNFADYPDLAPVFIVLNTLLKINTRFTGLETLRVKESDRVAVLRDTLAQLSATVTEEHGTWILYTDEVIFPEQVFCRAEEDHRMAMAFSLLAAKIKQVTIDDEQCVSKSYPHYWEQLSSLGFDLSYGTLQPLS